MKTVVSTATEGPAAHAGYKQASPQTGHYVLQVVGDQAQVGSRWAEHAAKPITQSSESQRGEMSKSRPER